MSIVTTITAPSGAAITREEAGAWLRLEPDTILDESAILDDLIAAATGIVESRCALRLITQTVEIASNVFLDALPIAPVQSIGSIRYRPYYDLTKYENLDSALWRAANLNVPRANATEIVKIAAWPQLSQQKIDVDGYAYGGSQGSSDSVIVTATVGWPSRENIPAGIKTAMRMLIATAYVSRSGNASRRMLPSRASIDALLEPFRSL